MGIIDLLPLLLFIAYFNINRDVSVVVLFACILSEENFHFVNFTQSHVKALFLSTWALIIRVLLEAN